MRKTLMTASAIAAASLAASTLMPAMPAFAVDQLTVTSWGGPYQTNVRKAIFEPFTKATGIKVIENEYGGEVAKVRAMVETKTVNWDVLDAETGAGAQMCAEGLLETIDWKKLGLDRTKFISSEVHDCGVPTLASGTIVAYDKDKLPNGPKSIADLFDTKKLPGKRGMWRSPYPNLEWALMADGVPTKDVYKVLGTPEGVDRAFKKLDTIKKDIIWWTAGPQPRQLLDAGETIMSAAWYSTIYDSIKNSGKHFAIMWDAQAFTWNNWLIPKGSPRLDEAYKFLAFAASAKSQAELTRYSPYGPANKDAMALVDPTILPDLQTTPEHMANALDSEAGTTFWIEKDDELRQRFNAWLAQ
ncbi:ABC transporter substrate-binding protein [Bradyrhizobium sp. F1.13.3]|uniref:ABC transporter substrate-binding protein n=1 Tax=Bradyrhizobium sp. F1.13.3 TaxID=3156351 RepID=UPI00339A1C61